MFTGSIMLMMIMMTVMMFMMMRMMKEIDELKKMEHQMHTPPRRRFSLSPTKHLRHRQNITQDITPHRIDFEDEFNNAHIEDNNVG